jgi:hypothetical protein
VSEQALCAVEIDKIVTRTKRLQVLVVLVHATQPKGMSTAVEYIKVLISSSVMSATFLYSLAPHGLLDQNNNNDKLSACLRQ